MPQKPQRQCEYTKFVVLPKNVKVEVPRNGELAAGADPLQQRIVDAAAQVAAELGPNWIGTITYDKGWHLSAICKAKSSKIAVVVFFDVTRDRYYATLAPGIATAALQTAFAGAFHDPRTAVREAISKKREALREEQALVDAALDALI